LWLTGALLLAAGWSAARAAPPGPAPVGAIPPSSPILDPNVVPAGCATCGGGGGTIEGGSGGCSGCGSGCVPGRDASACCCGIAADTACGRFLSDVYSCICCPDPCYVPHWTALADAAFFVDAVRPITQMDFRYDHAWSFENPDRAEYLMARERLNPTQVGPAGNMGMGKGLPVLATKVDYDQLNLYTEGATGKIGAFVEMNYLSLDPTVSPLSPGANGASSHASGFGDMTVGTKTMLLDCELMQFGFEFKTFMPTGAFTKGLGTGHVSLEPSLLWAVRLCPDCYLQAQMSYWIPLGGDPLYEGNIYHNHVSANFLLWRPCPGLQLIATAEVNQWLVLGGDYTSPNFVVNGTPVAISSRDAAMLSAGPGLRLVVCDKIDIGAGSAFALTGSRFADQMLRVEFRWRF